MFFGHGQFRKEQQLLMHRRDAGGGVASLGEANFTHLAVDENLAFVGLMQPGHDLDHGGLAGTVLAHQGMHFARADVEADGIHNLDAGKGLGYRAQFNRQRLRLRVKPHLSSAGGPSLCVGSHLGLFVRGLENPSPDHLLFRPLISGGEANRVKKECPLAGANPAMISSDHNRSHALL